MIIDDLLCQKINKGAIIVKELQNERNSVSISKELPSKPAISSVLCDQQVALCPFEPAGCAYCATAWLLIDKPVCFIRRRSAVCMLYGVQNRASVGVCKGKLICTCGS
jgi:hypothetical protein